MAKHIEVSLSEIIAAALLFIMMQPSFTWAWNLFLVQVFLMLIMALNYDVNRRGNTVLFFVFVAILSIIPISQGHNLLGILVYLLLAFVPFTKPSFALNTFQVFKFILSILTAISIIVWLLVCVFHIGLPFSVIAPLNDLKDYDYLSYPFLVVPRVFVDVLPLSRFHCVFDEPGVVGTYSLLFLYIGSFDLKKWDHIIFLIAGLISFSLFFYIGIVLFAVLKVFLNKSQKKYRFLSIALVSLLILATQSIPLLNDIIGSRMVFDTETRTLSGDNRSGGELKDYINSIRGTDKYFWGDTRQIQEMFAGEAGLNNAILRYGMVFIVLFFVVFLALSWNHLKKKTEVFLFMLLLFVTLYQRPGFVDPVYLFMFYSVLVNRKFELDNNYAYELVRR